MSPARKWRSTRSRTPGVIGALEPFMLLRADVTDNNDDDQALLQRFRSFGPPTIAFFDRSGFERDNFKLVGFVPAEKFHEHVAESRRTLRSRSMARSRPVLLTAALSAAAVLGYLAYRVARARPAMRSATRPTTEPARRRAAGRRDAARFLAGEPRRRAAIDPELARQTAADQFLGDLVRAVPARDSDAQGAADCAARPASRRHRHRQAATGRQVRGRPCSSTTRSSSGRTRRGPPPAALGVNIYALPFTVFTAGDGSILGVHTGRAACRAPRGVPGRRRRSCAPAGSTSSRLGAGIAGRI